MKNYLDYIKTFENDIHLDLDPYGEEIWEDAINSLRIVYGRIENFDMITDIEMVNYFDGDEEIPEISFKIKDDEDYSFSIYKEFDSRDEEPVMIEVVYRNLLRSLISRMVDDLSEESLYNNIVELYNMLKNKKYK